MLRLLLPVFLILLSVCCLAQKEAGVEDDLPTENLDMRKDSNNRSNRPKRRNYGFIYVPNANDILYGNRCALEETRKMGFEYVVEPYGLPGSKTRTGKFLNNLLVKTKLVVTRSPFWKVILRKRINNCRSMSGDLVG